jgi:hypothetical protein
MAGHAVRLSSLALVLVALACDGNQETLPEAGADGSVEGADDVSSEPDAFDLVSGPNVVPLIVNQGSPGSNSVDEPFISVTVCVPGTSQCQTIDNILVDTSSTGLRIMSSVLTGVTLPTQTTTSGGTLVECEEFGGEYQWGSVRLGDLQLGGEVAPNLPVHVVGDPQFTSVPTECSSSGPPQLTPAELGANGLFGISTFVYDCGTACGFEPA